jgi:cobalt/nickel transport protein
MFVLRIVLVFFIFVSSFVSISFAHFGMVIPSDTMILPNENRKIGLQLLFAHPFEGHTMHLAKPKQFFVFSQNKKQSLLHQVKEYQARGKQAWKTRYRLKRPGAHIFVMEPQPYWEKTENSFIIHYTKTVVVAFGDDQGWDQELGLPIEIIPLSHPFGLFRGNLFQGIVKKAGKPVPFAKIEVEYFNRNGKAKAANPYMISQTIKADQNGVFSYSVPRSGWWGFAALETANYQIKHKNKKKNVEIGGVIWVKFHSWKEQN